MTAKKTPRTRLRIALDHNFPVPIVDALGVAISDELIPIARIDRRMADLDDRDVIRALHVRGFDILVSCDYDMLREPSVLAAIVQTKLSVVAALGQGHDHVAASGLVLAHLHHVASQYRSDEAQLFRLQVTRKRPDAPWDLLGEAATKQKRDTKALFEEHRLSKAELGRDPLGD